MQTLPKSKYLEYFTENEAPIRESLEVIGNIIVVERIKMPEARTASGLYLAESPKSQLNSLVSDRPSFYRVLHVGAGYYDDETGADVGLNAKPGDIALLASASVKLFSSIPLMGAYESDTLGIARDEDVQIRFHGQEAFERFLTGLDKHVKAQVVGQPNEGR